MTRRLTVLDASVGVKWFRDEVDSDKARELLIQHRQREIHILVDDLFFYEVMSVVSNRQGREVALTAWDTLMNARLGRGSLDRIFMRAVLDMQHQLGCALYDAVAPARAEQLGATLVSADRRAHVSFPGVVLLGV